MEFYQTFGGSGQELGESDAVLLSHALEDFAGGIAEAAYNAYGKGFILFERFFEEVFEIALYEFLDVFVFVVALQGLCALRRGN